MLVYKYRGGSNEVFQRDLQTIELDQFYSASIESLNDPCEGITDTRRVQKPLRYLGKKIGMRNEEDFDLLDSNTNQVLSLNRSRGIYSLSHTHLDELLWAHYANSHKGFCLEYNLNELLENIANGYLYSGKMKYRNQPPKIGLLNTLNHEEKRMIVKYGLCKSKRWEYEQEHRIVTKNIGLHNYTSETLKGIYFGFRMANKHKEEIMDRLKDKKINYHQIKLKKSSYKLISYKL